MKGLENRTNELLILMKRTETTPFLWDVRCRTPHATYPDGNAETRDMPSLFGLAPGGACRAVFVAEDAVRSYRTISTLPGRSHRRFDFCGAIPGVASAGTWAQLAEKFSNRNRLRTAIFESGEAGRRNNGIELLASSIRFFICDSPAALGEGTSLRSSTSQCEKGKAIVPKAVPPKCACTLRRRYRRSLRGGNGAGRRRSRHRRRRPFRDASRSRRRAGHPRTGR